MRKVNIAESVWVQINDLADYLVEDLKISESSAHDRCARMIDFIASLSAEVDYPLCRFRRWRKLGYRCAVFERDWVLAYEVFKEGVVVRDMSHVKLLKG
ncbi:MAG: hypothetical protein LBM63_02875 [Rikenellaceae bacterium]|jgi:hypothetical protein|nr:hypothetical protein [Rikenellaceae bacterium]